MFRFEPEDAKQWKDEAVRVLEGTLERLRRFTAEAFAPQVEETSEAVIVRIPVPGIGPEQCEVQVLGEELTVRVRDENAKDGVRERKIRLGVPIEPEGAQARCRHGLLTVQLPKAAGARPHVIPVQGE